MGWHIVWALGGVGVEGIALGNEPSEPRLEVTTRTGVRVFLDDEARGGVLHKYGAQSLGDPGRANDSFDIGSDVDEPLAGRFDGQRTQHLERSVESSAQGRSLRRWQRALEPAGTDPRHQTVLLKKSVVPREDDQNNEPDDITYDVVRIQNVVYPFIERHVTIGRARQRPQRDPGSHPHAIAKLMEPQCEHVDERFSPEQQDQRKREVDRERMKPHSSVVDGVTEDDEPERLVDHVGDERQEDDPPEVRPPIEAVASNASGCNVTKD